jgi:hypothetical protein
MLDCSEVSIEKDPTLKNIIGKYENEIKIHVKLEHELKAIVKQHEAKLKERDDFIKELQESMEVASSHQAQKKEIRTLQKRNSELSLNLHDEIRQKLKIFKQLKRSTDCGGLNFGPPEAPAKSAASSKRKLSTSALASSKKGALKLSFDVGKSPQSLSRKGSVVEASPGGGLFTGTAESKSPVGTAGVVNFFAGRRDRKKKSSSVILSFEDDLKRFFTGYFSSKQAFMTTNNSLNKSQNENRRGRDRERGPVDRLAKRE